jgi:hypothetical protein
LLRMQTRMTMTGIAMMKILTKLTIRFACFTVGGWSNGGNLIFPADSKFNAFDVDFAGRQLGC